ncbi:MAG: hypothetical protein R3A47_09220 [Polyangiales bacterium]
MHDGKVTVFPGTLDDYLWTCADQGKRAVGLVDEAKQAETATSSEKVTSKERRRQEAEERQAQEKKLKPLKRKLETLEKKIAKLEALQNERNAELSSPELYENAAKRDETLTAYRRTQAELEVLTESWMEAQAELEALNA